MKKEFTANILFLVAINLVIKPFYSLAIDTSVQNAVGPESYGLFLALFNFVYIQQIFADLGIQNYNNRSISRKPELLKEFLPNILGAKIIFTIFFIIIVYGTSWIFEYDQYFNEILVWIIGTQACLSFLLYCRTNISGLGRYYTDSVFSVLDKFILIIWMSYLLWFNPPSEGLTIIHFVKAQFFSVSLSLLISLTYTHTTLSKLSLSFSLSFLKSLVKESLPYATLVILMAGYSRMDSIMLQQLLDDNALEAGKYASSFRLYDTYNNFAFLFAVLLLPMFSRMIAKNENVRALVQWAVKLLCLASIFGIVFSYFQGFELLSFFYDREIDSSYLRSFFYLMLAALPLSLNYVYGTLLTANGSLKVLNLIAIAGFVMNLALNFFFIPKFGSAGAAFATFFTQAIVWGLQLYFCRKTFDLKFDWSLLMKLLLILISFVAISYCAMKFLQFSFILKTLILVASYLMLAFLLRLIKVSDFKIVSSPNRISE